MSVDGIVNWASVSARINAISSKAWYVCCVAVVVEVGEVEIEMEVRLTVTCK